MVKVERIDDETSEEILKLMTMMQPSPNGLAEILEQ
jgi:hypothetical protein